MIIIDKFINRNVKVLQKILKNNLKKNIKSNLNAEYFLMNK